MLPSISINSSLCIVCFKFIFCTQRRKLEEINLEYRFSPFLFEVYFSQG
jgi:hypothetical protein